MEGVGGAFVKFNLQGKEKHNLKQVKIEKYPQDKVVCWDFFLTLLNPVSLFPIEFNNASQYPVAIDDFLGEWGVCSFLRLQSSREER